jgi:hypothetical protein
LALSVIDGARQRQAECVDGRIITARSCRMAALKSPIT